VETLCEILKKCVELRLFSNFLICVYITSTFFRILKKCMDTILKKKIPKNVFSSAVGSLKMCITGIFMKQKKHSKTAFAYSMQSKNEIQKFSIFLKF
jgi:hypothetical protein